jgi:hypothetical protein
VPVDHTFIFIDYPGGIVVELAENTRLCERLDAAGNPTLQEGGHSKRSSVSCAGIGHPREISRPTLAARRSPMFAEPSVSDQFQGRRFPKGVGPEAVSPGPVLE